MHGEGSAQSLLMARATGFSITHVFSTHQLPWGLGQLYGDPEELDRLILKPLGYGKYKRLIKN